MLIMLITWHLGFITSMSFYYSCLFRSQIVDLGSKLDAAVREKNEVNEALKKNKVTLQRYEKGNPDLTALRKEIEERDTTIQVMWIENEDLKAEIIRSVEKIEFYYKIKTSLHLIGHKMSFLET